MTVWWDGCGSAVPARPSSAPYNLPVPNYLSRVRQRPGTRGRIGGQRVCDRRATMRPTKNLRFGTATGF